MPWSLDVPAPVPPSWGDCSWDWIVKMQPVFSFLLGLPAIAGSGFLQLHILIDAGLSAIGFLNLSIGILAAFVSGYISIELLLRFIKKIWNHRFLFYTGWSWGHSFWLSGHKSLLFIPSTR